MRKITLALLCLCIGVFCAAARDIVKISYTPLSGSDIITDSVRVRGSGLDNIDGNTNVSYKILNITAPFELYDVKLLTHDGTLSPLTPPAVKLSAGDTEGKVTEVSICTAFPPMEKYYPDDRIVLTTNVGTFTAYITLEGRLKEENAHLSTDLQHSRAAERKVWFILIAILLIAAVGGLCIHFIIRHRLRERKNEIEGLSMMLAQRNAHNRELQERIDNLYGSRLDTLNMLCNEYFEKNESEQIRLTLYNEVEKQILSLRDTKSVKDLENIVNTYLDNILLRLHEQIPTLNRADLKFLTYLYAGFSPRAICIFTDIKIKNFYNRRSRLKDRILASDAPDREWFVSKM